MASTIKSNNEEDNKKTKNKNKAAAATPTKKTPTKKTPQNSPTKKTPAKKTPTKSPKQEKDKKKNTDNGRVTESPEVIPSSSCDSQDIEHEIGEENAPRIQPSSKKSNKRKQKARNDEEEEGDGSMCKFPMARIKRIIKSEDPSLQLPQDVVFLVNKATEKFIQQFCEEAYHCSVRDRKKALAYKHLSTVVSEKRRFDFLSDYVPEKLKAEAALEQRKLVENGQV